MGLYADLVSADGSLDAAAVHIAVGSDHVTFACCKFVVVVVVVVVVAVVNCIDHHIEAVEGAHIGAVTLVQYLYHCNKLGYLFASGNSAVAVGAVVAGSHIGILLTLVADIEAVVGRCTCLGFVVTGKHCSYFGVARMDWYRNCLVDSVTSVSGKAIDWFVADRRRGVRRFLVGNWLVVAAEEEHRQI